ncbi:MAG: glycosyltransferase family 2 protein [Pseudobdellovibrionaceae bacterium]
MNLPLSVAIITFNEERNLPRLLESLDFAAEIVILDSLSTDGTQQAVEDFQKKSKQSIRFEKQPFLGFGLQKQKATDLCTYPWVLNLDADERISPELKKELLDKFPSLDQSVSYSFPRKSFHLGRWILHGGWYPDRQVRLYHRDTVKWSTDNIHEKLNFQKVKTFQSPILHYVFRDLSHQVMTNDKYSTLQAEKEMARGRSFVLLRLLVKPWVKFFECYVFKLGFLDGLPGFIIAVGAAHSVFLRWSKVWEKKNT